MKPSRSESQSNLSSSGSGLDFAAAFEARSVSLVTKSAALAELEARDTTKATLPPVAPPLATSPRVQRGMRQISLSEELDGSIATVTELIFAQQQQQQGLGRRARLASDPSGQSLDLRSPVAAPSDAIVLTEIGGALVVTRTAEARMARPDRLDLDRRQLKMVPLVEGETTLRLLNLQHNTIARLGSMAGLRGLIFLDLYDNQIEDLTGLDAVPALRVLMLGRNRLRSIAGLAAVPRLDVLDLHGNCIEEIEGLQGLVDLRVLNLASNALTSLSGLPPLPALAELNLRRNKITAVPVLPLPALERLFLSHNEITTLGDLAGLPPLPALAELALDGNPVCREPCYRDAVVDALRTLRLLDARRVADDERRGAAAALKRDTDRRREAERAAQQKSERARAIEGAQQRWQDLLASLARPAPPAAPARPLSAALPAPSAALIRKLSAGPLGRTPRIPPRPPPGPAPPGQFHVELDGDALHIYGDALEALDKPWAGPVSTLAFHYVLFDSIVPWLPRIRARFPALHTLVLADTHLHALPQIAHLATLRRLEHLHIIERQPVLALATWRPYTVQRLAGLPLKTINGVPVSLTDQRDAALLFGDLIALQDRLAPPASAPAPAPALTPAASAGAPVAAGPAPALPGPVSPAAPAGASVSQDRRRLEPRRSLEDVRAPNEKSRARPALAPSARAAAAAALVERALVAAQTRRAIAVGVEEVWPVVVAQLLAAAP
eukprot:m.106766 g.106766  ORF g.106766 m.106766 type:complete len:725 (+) comp14237_c0_seq2:752-2926(+)